MEEYIYQEENYISSKDFNHFNELLLENNNKLEHIADEHEFNIVLRYLVSLTERASNFIPAYKYATAMVNKTELNEELTQLREKLFDDWFEACMRVAKRDDIFNKMLSWQNEENHPIIQGLFFGAQRIWVAGKTKEAYKIFCKIDYVRARFYAKATGQGMTSDEFDQMFAVPTSNGILDYKENELRKWFGE